MQGASLHGCTGCAASQRRLNFVLRAHFYMFLTFLQKFCLHGHTKLWTHITHKKSDMFVHQIIQYRSVEILLLYYCNYCIVVLLYYCIVVLLYSYWEMRTITYLPCKASCAIVSHSPNLPRNRNCLVIETYRVFQRYL